MNRVPWCYFCYILNVAISAQTWQELKDMLKFSPLRSELVDNTFQILFKQGFTKLKLVSLMSDEDRSLLHIHSSLLVAQGAVLRKLASELSGYTEAVNKDYLTPPGSKVPSVQGVRRLEGAGRIQSGNNPSEHIEVQNIQNIQGMQTPFNIFMFSLYKLVYFSSLKSSISDHSTGN